MPVVSPEKFAAFDSTLSMYLTTNFLDFKVLFIAMHMYINKDGENTSFVMWCLETGSVND